MTNAKDEFLEEVAGKVVKCAEVTWGDSFYENSPRVMRLKVGCSQEDYDRFLSYMDFQYYSGYGGGQELFGTIWYEDGTWSERGEYDGSEWWEHRKLPEIPATLGGEASSDAI